MNTNEIVRALRICNNPKGHRCSECPVFSRYEYRVCKATVDRTAAALIESQAAKITELNDFENSQCAKLLEELNATERRAQDARNELCQKCGRYREAHNGACNGCRWKE